MTSAYRGRVRVSRTRAWLAGHRWVGDVGGAALAVLLALPVTLGRGPVASLGAGALAWVLAAAVPLVWRRRRPVLVFALVLAVATSGSLAVGESLPSAVLLALVALWSVAVRVGGPRLWAVVAAAEAGVLGIALALDGTRSPDGERISLWAVLPVLAALPAAVAALGANRRVHRAYLEALEDRASRLEVEREHLDALAGAAERARIAREMHDVVSHSLTVVVTLAEGVAAGARADPSRASDPVALGALAATGREALAEMRRLLDVLADGEPDEEGDDGDHRRPGQGADDLDAVVAKVRAAGVRVALTRQGVAAEGSVGAAVHRIVQECLTNTLRHAGPGSSAAVLVSWHEHGVVVQVDDDGPVPTAVPAATSPGAGRGLRGMAERAAAFHGTVRAGPRRPRGWQVRVELSTRAPIVRRPGGPPPGVPSSSVPAPGAPRPAGGPVTLHGRVGA